MRDYLAWREACEWISTSSGIPRDARFLTPRVSQTFKWYAGRAEVVNWKEIPQDPESVVEWWYRLNNVFSTGSEDPANRWHQSLGELGADRLRQLGEKYDADFVITRRWPWVYGLEAVYWDQDDPKEKQDAMYIIYRLGSSETP
jgi:hypothetical protein